MLEKVRAPGLLYIGEINSDYSSGRILRAVELEKQLTKIILLNPKPNSRLKFLINDLAHAEISVIIISNQAINFNSQGLADLAVVDIWEEVKRLLPNRSFISPGEDLKNIEAPLLTTPEEWYDGQIMAIIHPTKDNLIFWHQLIDYGGQLKNSLDKTLTTLSKLNGGTKTIELAKIYSQAFY